MKGHLLTGISSPMMTSSAPDDQFSPPLKIGPPLTFCHFNILSSNFAGEVPSKKDLGAWGQFFCHLPGSCILQTSLKMAILPINGLLLKTFGKSRLKSLISIKKLQKIILLTRIWWFLGFRPVCKIHETWILHLQTGKCYWFEIFTRVRYCQNKLSQIGQAVVR